MNSSSFSSMLCLMLTFFLVKYSWLTFHGNPKSAFDIYSFFFFPFYGRICGGTQARGRIGAAASGQSHSHSHANLSCICDLLHSSRQCQTLSPLSEASDQTYILTGTARGPQPTEPHRELLTPITFP